MRATYITFRGSYQLPIGFPGKMIVLTRRIIKVTMTVSTKEFRFFNVFKKIIVTTLHLIASITFGLVTMVMHIVLREISLFTLQTEVDGVEESRKGRNDIKMSVMHQKEYLFFTRRTLVHNGMFMFRRDDDKLIITQDNFKQFDLFQATWARGNARLLLQLVRQCFLQGSLMIFDELGLCVPIGHGLSHHQSTSATQVVLVLDSEDRSFVFQELAVIVCPEAPPLPTSLGFTAARLGHRNMGDVEL